MQKEEAEMTECIVCGAQKNLETKDIRVCPICGEFACYPACWSWAMNCCLECRDWVMKRGGADYVV